MADQEQPTAKSDKTLREPDPSVSDAEPSVAPEGGRDLRLKQRVQDALDASPGGEQLDRYFGVSSGEPEQPPEEAHESGELVDALREATSSGTPNLGELLSKIAQHADSSGADPDALRALMRGPKKQVPPRVADTEEG